MRPKLSGHALFESLNRPRYICAPMVDQSELAFRMLCREYGTQLCYTPMIHARLFLNCSTYRNEVFTTCPDDRPLIAQFCGDDAETICKAAQLIQHQCDAIDLNLGCPQNIAKRGHYGAFLLPERDLVVSIVKHLNDHLEVPVTCKIRLLPSINDTIALATALEEAGCAWLCVHGRRREELKQNVGVCNWDALRQIREAISIPMIANGGIFNLADAERCIHETGVVAVMSSEALLENPALFCDNRSPDGSYIDQFAMATKYLELSKEHKATSRQIRAHLFKILHGSFLQHTDLRDQFSAIACRDLETTMPKLLKVVDELRARYISHDEVNSNDFKDDYKVSEQPWTKFSELSEAIVLTASGDLLRRAYDEARGPAQIAFPRPGSWYFRHHSTILEASPKEATSTIFCQSDVESDEQFLEMLKNKLRRDETMTEDIQEKAAALKARLKQKYNDKIQAKRLERMRLTIQQQKIEDEKFGGAGVVDMSELTIFDESD